MGLLALAPLLPAQVTLTPSEHLQQDLTELLADGDSSAIALAYQRLAESRQSEGNSQAAIEAWRRAIVFARGAVEPDE